MKQKIIINFIEFPQENKIHSYYKDAFFDLFENFGIRTYCLIAQSYSDLGVLNATYNSFGIYFDVFDSVLELQNKMKHVDVIEMVTFTERLIPLLLSVRKAFGLPYTLNGELFRNKKLQREYLFQYAPQISVKFKEFSSIDEIQIEALEKEFSYPFVIKPVSGVQSQLVYKVNTKEDFFCVMNTFKQADKTHYYSLNGVKGEISVLIEEYIDGEMYSLNYFVDENQQIYQSKLVKVLSGQQLGMNDFFNFVRLSGPMIDQELKDYDLHSFVQKNVLATGIRSSFVFHEFKLNSQGILKTIELNGRIGGYRLEMMQEGYQFNILRFLLGIKMSQSYSNVNLGFFVFYAKKKGILEGFNTELIDEVEKCQSYMSKNILQANIGKATGLTSDGFTKNMIIKIKNENPQQFKIDYTFIEKNYFDFIRIR